MSDMKIAVGLRREPGTDLFIFSFCQILLYNLFNKIFGNCFVLHSFSSSHYPGTSLERS